MEQEGCRPGILGTYRIHGMIPGLQPSNCFDVRIPRDVPQAGMEPGLSPLTKPGVGLLNKPCLRLFPTPAPKVRTIPAYGIAIGIEHRHKWRAESPVSSPEFMSGTDGSGLQPSDSSFADPNLGLYPRLGWVRTVGAGEGDKPRMDANAREWVRVIHRWRRWPEMGRGTRECGEGHWEITPPGIPTGFCHKAHGCTAEVLPWVNGR